MFDRHAAFRQELSQAQRFLDTVNTHRDRVRLPDSTTVTSYEDDILQHVSVAFEDIPEDMHEAVRVVLMRPTEDRSLREQLVAVVTNVAGGGFGELEAATGRLALLHMLSCLSIHAPYTYRLDSSVIRGSRPTPDKLRRLYAGGCRATINLCREMPRGDDDIISAAGLTGQMATEHIEITDNTPPTPDQVDTLIAYLNNCDGTVYVHCEAGVGRTGVMVACYRMAQGWTLAHALDEARQFGCAMPDQLAFIEDRGAIVGTALTSPVAQPSDEVLKQTAAMNRDPVGLTRALARMTEVLPAEGGEEPGPNAA